jgi:hypothetical protein
MVRRTLFILLIAATIDQAVAWALAMLPAHSPARLRSVQVSNWPFPPHGIEGWGDAPDAASRVRGMGRTDWQLRGTVALTWDPAYKFVEVDGFATGFPFRSRAAWHFTYLLNEDGDGAGGAEGGSWVFDDKVNLPFRPILSGTIANIAVYGSILALGLRVRNRHRNGVPAKSGDTLKMYL